MRACTPQLQTLQFVSCGSVLWSAARLLVSLLFETWFFNILLQDGTLANTNSGAKFPLGGDDWKLYNSRVPEEVQKFAADGYKIVIFRHVHRMQHLGMQHGMRPVSSWSHV